MGNPLSRPMEKPFHPVGKRIGHSARSVRCEWLGSSSNGKDDQPRSESAKTELSQDGKVLVVHRFDVDENGKPFRAMEDFCALLGLRPQNKYETTWERIAKAVRDHVNGS
jgi:hypothetical protein